MIDKRFARYAKYRRIVNGLRDKIWKVQRILRKAICVVTGIGGLQVHEGSLGIRVKRNGIWYNFGTVAHKVITTEYAEFYVDQLIAEDATFGDFKWHQIGTGSTAENKTDSALVTPVEAVTSGSQVEDSSKVYKSIADIAITAQRLLREHGIFNAEGLTILMDRTVYALVTLENGDIFQATYKLTVSDDT